MSTRKCFKWNLLRSGCTDEMLHMAVGRAPHTSPARMCACATRTCLCCIGHSPSRAQRGPTRTPSPSWSSSPSSVPGTRMQALVRPLPSQREHLIVTNRHTVPGSWAQMCHVEKDTAYLCSGSCLRTEVPSCPILAPCKWRRFTPCAWGHRWKHEQHVGAARGHQQLGPLLHGLQHQLP